MGAVLTFVTMGQYFPVFMATLGLTSTFACGVAGAFVAMIAIGFDLDWLQIALAVIGVAVSIYSLWSNFGIMLDAATGVYSVSAHSLISFLSQEQLAFLYSLTFGAKLLISTILIVLTAGLYVALHDDVSVLEGAGSVLGDIAGDIGHAGGEIIDGIINGGSNIIDSTVGGLLKHPIILIGGLVGIWYLFFKDDESSTEKVNISLSESKETESY